MNFIFDVLSQKPDYKISVITSFNSSPFANQEFEGVKIFRLGSVSENSIKRYLSYLMYNIFSVLILFIKRPDVVVVYETLSIFPAYIFSKVFKKKKIHVHYHEYMSIKEKKAASLYMKFLLLCERNLLKKVTCSQTNEDRKAMFLKDNTYLHTGNLEVYPNLPPKTWWRDYGQHKIAWQGGKIKLVYVGVLDAETMYLKEVLQWVSQHPNELELTLFSQDVSLSARKLFSQFKSDNILLKSALEYNTLPQELIKHDVGLVLYKGHIPNYVFNVPNKVYEYLSCGLKVIGDKALIMLGNSSLKGVYQIEFNNFKHFDICEAIEKNHGQSEIFRNSLVDFLFIKK